MRKYFLTLAVWLLMCAGVMAQNSPYTNAIKEYLQNNGSDLVGNMGENYGKITPYAVAYAQLDDSSIDYEECTKRYTETQLLTDISEIYAPFFYEQDITLDELNDLVALCKNPGYIQANAHINEIDMDKAVEKEIADKLAPAMLLICAGNESTDFKASAPPSYVSAFHEYYQLSGIQDIIAPYMKAFFWGYTSGKTIDDKAKEKCIDYSSRNMETLLVDVFYEHLTTDDIKAYMEVCKQPAFDKVKKAIAAYLDNIDSIAMSLVTKYGNWIKREYGNIPMKDEMLSQDEIFSEAPPRTVGHLDLGMDVIDAVPEPDSPLERSADENMCFDVVEQMPSFPGGQAAMMQFLSENIEYPVIAQEYGTEGRVVVGFIVEKDGSISNVNLIWKLSNPMTCTDMKTGKPIIVDPGRALDQEAVRVIKMMPTWIPGKQNGEPVRVKYNIPVGFKLQ